MAHSTVIVWTPQEQAIAREAFDLAHGRAVSELISKVQGHASGVGSVDALWQLHDFLSTQRHDLEGRFDFRLEGILFVFASFVRMACSPWTSWRAWKRRNWRKSRRWHCFKSRLALIFR
jgi:hypothetical protein